MSYIHCVGFLRLVQIVTNGLPRMDGDVLMALVVRWCLKMHTFHLSSGEMTIMLHDVGMVLRFSTDRLPMAGYISSAGWCDRVGEWLGVRPDDPAEDTRDNRPAAVLASWLRANFNFCT